MVNGWYRCSRISGWWFQTRFYFPFHIWDVILPIDELHHFSAGFWSTTNQPFFLLVKWLFWFLNHVCWWNTTIFHGEIATFPSIHRDFHPSKPGPARDRAQTTLLQQSSCRQWGSYGEMEDPEITLVFDIKMEISIHGYGSKLGTPIIGWWILN